MPTLVLLLAGILAAFFVLFIAIGLGMAVSDFAANMFLLGVLVLVAIVAACVRWWRRSQK